MQNYSTIKSGFKRTINWNKYQSDIKKIAESRYLNHLINPSFQGVSRLFVLSFENENDRTWHSTYYLPKVKIIDYNVMIDGKTFFDQIAWLKHTKYYKNCCRSSGWLYNWWFVRLSLFQRSWQIDCNIFKQTASSWCRSKSSSTNFMANLDRDGNTTMFFIIEEAKETVLDFSQGTIKVF